MLRNKSKTAVIMLVLLGIVAVTCGTLFSSMVTASENDKKLQDQTAKEMKQLQGMWIAESAQPQSAQFTTHESAPYMILTVKGNALQFEIRAEGDAVPTPRNEKFAIRYDLSKYCFAIDPTKNPKRLWTTKTEKEPEAFRWFPECGYEVTGDRLRIVANFIRGGFPDSLTATESRHVYTFRRVTTDPRTNSGERKK
jgi:hypothetical protein